MNKRKMMVPLRLEKLVIVFLSVFFQKICVHAKSYFLHDFISKRSRNKRRMARVYYAFKDISLNYSQICI